MACSKTSKFNCPYQLSLVQQMCSCNFSALPSVLSHHIKFSSGFIRFRASRIRSFTLISRIS